MPDDQVPDDQAVGLFEIVDRAIDPQALIARVANPRAGAIVVFIGTVREFSLSGRAVSHLEYEAYAEMAVAKLAEVAAEVRSRWGLDRVAITHRVGRLAVGDAAVVIAVASPHRKPAFEACEYTIDRLKQIVPIWKKEIGPDGASWVE